jgi:hypothetical protein
MGLYRLSHRLNANAGVLEGFVGTEVGSDRPVVAKRALGPAAGGDAGRALHLEPIPGLAERLEVGASGDQLWVVENLVESEPLRQVMSALANRKGFIAPNEGLSVVGRVATLLSTLHQRRPPVVHGDVCASTVLLTPEGEVLLADAGVASALERGPTGPARSEPFSLAPEQLQQSPGPATDVFQLGLVLYELAVGRPLFCTGDPAQALLLCQRYAEPPAEAVSHVPEPWRTLVLQMLAVEPADRPDAASIDRRMREAVAAAGWRSAEQEISRLFHRACPERQPLAAQSRGGARLLTVTPLAGPAPRSAAPASLPHPLSPPAAVRPPAGLAPPSPPTGAVVGRISTRKMSLSQLEAARGERVHPKASPPEAAVTAVATEEADGTNAPKDAQLGELLVTKELVTRAQLDDAKHQVGAFGGTLADALVSSGACGEDAIVAALAGATKTPHLTAKKLAELAPPKEALSRVSLELARRFDLVPLGLKGGTQLVVAMKDPLDVAAQEALKAATGLRSVVAMRAGETAIRNARNRLYGQSADETPDWLERDAAARPRSSPRPPPPTALPAPSPREVASSPSLSQEPPVVTGSLLSQVIALEPAPLTLEDSAGRLVMSLLPMLGERGQAVLAVASTAAGLAARLGAGGSDAEKVRFVAVALGVANLHDGRPPFDVPTIGGLSRVLGEAGWNEVEAVVSPWLDWPTTLPREPLSRALCLALGFALHAHHPRPPPGQLAAALASFKARFQLPPEAVAALASELNPS